METPYTEFDLMDKVEKKLYKAWYNMKARCYNPKYHGFKNYGGKGVYVEEEWMDFDTFNIQVRYIPGWDEKLFMQGKLSLDKDYFSKGDSKYYGREVCCWLTQSLNTKLRHYDWLEIDFNTYTAKTLEDIVEEEKEKKANASWDRIYWALEYI